MQVTKIIAHLEILIRDKNRILMSKLLKPKNQLKKFKKLFKMSFKISFN